MCEVPNGSRMAMPVAAEAAARLVGGGAMLQVAMLPSLWLHCKIEQNEAALWTDELWLV